jgi:putative endonuclease
LFLVPGRRRRMLTDPKLLGRWGEKRSERFLKNKGLRTIARNYSCKTGEIDLVMASDDGAIIFVEVKSRRHEDFARAQDAVNYAKRIKLIRTARSFIKTYNIKDKPVRFDVVAVVLGREGSARIRHYRNAFTP